MNARCLVMGIVNITDDSFSDGGEFADTTRAVAHAEALLAEGADIIDIGGESTRPGATRVTEETELSRVVPVTKELVARGFTVSVDTMRASVARAVAAENAAIINDVSGGLADPDMYAAMAESGADVVLMHWKTDRFGDASGSAHTGGNVLADVTDTFAMLVDNAVAHGVAPEKIILDPGLGFAKTPDDNWLLLNHLEEISSVGGEKFRLLVGASRKRFLQEIAAFHHSGSSTPKDADAATAAVSALSAAAGAWAVRVHAVAPSVAAVHVADRWGRGRG